MFLMSHFTFARLNDDLHNSNINQLEDFLDSSNAQAPRHYYNIPRQLTVLLLSHGSDY